MEGSRENPTRAVDLDFGAYLSRRHREIAAHMEAGGIADYSFGLDHTLRQRIAALAPARQIVRMISAASLPIQKYLHNMEMIAVGPRQFPELHAIAESCARTLGIGIPQIFIAPMRELAAYTFATEDISPIVVCSSGLIEAMEGDEMKFVVGHECGHIHNLHGAYNTAVQNLTNPLAKLIYEKVVGLGIAYDLVKSVSQARLVADAISGSLALFFLSWSRAAEVTCDRAGLICCGDPLTARRALARLATGGASTLRGINIEEYVKQLDRTRASPLRYAEFFGTHPLLPKRIQAVSVFAECEVFCAWRPDLPRPLKSLSRAEADAECARILGITGYGRSHKTLVAAGS
jgi:Zn-dependent protease with chaperone function